MKINDVAKIREIMDAPRITKLRKSTKNEKNKVVKSEE